MIKTCIRTEFSCDFYCQRTKLKSVIESLKADFPCISDDDVFDLYAIYNELIHNAIIHGNKLNSSKSVELVIETYDNVIISKIKDEGTGFNFYDVVNSLNSLDKVFCEHERGLQIVMGLADIVEMNESGNEIVFYKHLRNT